MCCAYLPQGDVLGPTTPSQPEDCSCEVHSSYECEALALSGGENEGGKNLPLKAELTPRAAEPVAEVL